MGTPRVAAGLARSQRVRTRAPTECPTGSARHHSSARLKRHSARSTSSNAFHDHLKVGCFRYIIRSICNCKLPRWWCSHGLRASVTAHTYADLFDDELDNIAAALDALPRTMLKPGGRRQIQNGLYAAPSWWPGPGSNRRPSAFQADAHTD